MDAPPPQETNFTNRGTALRRPNKFHKKHFAIPSYPQFFSTLYGGIFGTSVILELHLYMDRYGKKSVYKRNKQFDNKINFLPVV